ncbi:hypothetical protein DFH27DRAFT_26611 [Peziza echinospora]|nr:hypothetical protein DFH27DRAFT_26611 [Peziza echinospora]
MMTGCGGGCGVRENDQWMFSVNDGVVRVVCSLGQKPEGFATVLGRFSFSPHICLAGVGWAAIRAAFGAARGPVRIIFSPRRCLIMKVNWSNYLHSPHRQIIGFHCRAIMTQDVGSEPDCAGPLVRLIGTFSPPGSRSAQVSTCRPLDLWLLSYSLSRARLWLAEPGAGDRTVSPLFRYVFGVAKHEACNLRHGTGDKNS